jgi:hypothetical protein
MWIKKRSRGRSLNCVFAFFGRSEWPRVLRLGSAAARLLGLRVRITPVHGCLSVLSGVISCRGLCVGLITRLIPAECGVPECDCEATTMRRIWLTSGCCSTGREKFVVRRTYYVFRIYIYFFLFIFFFGRPVKFVSPS